MSNGHFDKWVIRYIDWLAGNTTKGTKLDSRHKAVLSSSQHPYRLLHLKKSISMGNAKTIPRVKTAGAVNFI